MKKQCYEHGAKLRRPLLALFLLCLTVHGAIAQVSLSTKRDKLQAVIHQLETSSKYTFFYSDALANVQVNAVNVKNEPMETLLGKLLTGTGISYKVAGKVIYLTKTAKDSDQKRHNQKSSAVKRTISGRITDEKGEPLIGVSVMVKGTTQGVVSDIEGNYAFTTEVENPTLVYSYIGYSPQQIASNSRTNIDVIMKEESHTLTDVVVTALGIKRSEKALSYNVQKLGDADFALKEASVANALNGKVAGVTISQAASGIGGSTKVVMRGDKSVNPDGNNNALYVLDGIPLPDLFHAMALSPMDNMAAWMMEMESRTSIWKT